MACLAAIQGRRCGKLTFVNVIVAILALRCRLYEFGVPAFGAFGYVALVAGDRDVNAFQRIFRGRMFLDTKRGGLPIGFIVARRAFAVIDTRAELSVMRVLVAIHAFGVRHGRLEIAFRVAVTAIYSLMLAQQGEFRFRVVEVFHLRYTRPTRSHVATLALSLEGALVWIGVAASAFRE